MKVSKLTKHQVKTFTADSNKIDKAIVSVDGVEYRKVVARVRFDDQCGNGHNTFSITGDAWCVGSRIRPNDPDVCGCIHEIIAAAFPDLARLIKWQLTSSESPMHYPSNAMYHARTSTHQGVEPGTPVKFESVVLLGNSKYPLRFKKAFMDYIQEAQKSGWILSIKEVAHKDDGGYKFAPKYTLSGFDCEWHQCPFDNLDEAKGFIDTYHDHGCAIVDRPTHYAQAVEPNIEAARRAAIWEGATLEQLQDKQALESRLPALMEEFATVIESLGMEF